MAAPPTKPGKYCMLNPSPPMGTFNTARSNQVSMTLPLHSFKLFFLLVLRWPLPHAAGEIYHQRHLVAYILNKCFVYVLTVTRWRFL